MEIRLEYVFLLCIQSVLTLFIRYVERTWYSPGAMFALIWNFIICFSVLSAPDYYFSIHAFYLILFFIIAFFIGGRAGNYLGILSQQSEESNRSSRFSTSKMEMLLKLGILSGFMAFFFLLKESGLVLGDIANLERIAAASYKVSSERYAGVRLSSLTMLFLMITYMVSFAAGLVLANKPGKRQISLVALLVLPVLLFTVFYTARSVLLYLLVIIGGAYLSFRPSFLKGNPVLFSKRNVVMGLGGIVLLFAVFVISQASRMKLSLSDSGQFTFITNYLKVWFSGNISGFCSWFDLEFNPALTNKGFYSLAGLSEWFGVSQRKVGIYETTIDVNHEMSFSNIYTLFRFIIDDFGLSGSFLIFITLGFVSSFLFRKSINGNLTAASLLSGIFALLLFSFISSIWAYNSILFGWICFSCYCFYTEKFS